MCSVHQSSKSNNIQQITTHSLQHNSQDIASFLEVTSMIRKYIAEFIVIYRYNISESRPLNNHHHLHHLRRDHRLRQELLLRQLLLPPLLLRHRLHLRRHLRHHRLKEIKKNNAKKVIC